MAPPEYQIRKIAGKEGLVAPQETTSGELKTSLYGKTAGGVITALQVDAAGKLVLSS